MKTFPQPRRNTLIATGLLAALLALAGCNRTDDKTAGQQLDSAIAKTEQAAAQAKAKTESSMASAGTAIKDATQNAEVSGKDMASKVGARIDDATITASVSARLVKDPDLSALKINVDTKGGEVVLNCTAPTQAARDKATTIVHTVDGVKSVDNKLTVQPAG